MLPHAHPVPNIHLHINEHMQLNTYHFNQRQAGNLSARYERHILCYNNHWLDQHHCVQLFIVIGSMNIGA
jgi:metal-responsive CopG/Arc/MetJ family transcriptional regulator